MCSLCFLGQSEVKLTYIMYKIKVLLIKTMSNYLKQSTSYTAYRLHMPDLSQRPIVRGIGGSIGKSDDKSNQWENLYGGKIIIRGDRH